MQYAFLFGPSGSGKTCEAFQEMIGASLEHPEKRFFVLVPEQHGVLMQKKLLELHPRHASGNIEVVSFNRLAFRVFAERNMRHLNVMDDSGKAMVLRRVASERRKELTVWGERMRQAGFTEQVKSLLSECMQYGIHPDDLLHLEGKPVHLPLRQKLGDLSVLYRGFLEYCQGKGLPKEALLELFAAQIRESALLRGAVFLFDGFTGFTPLQYRVIEELMQTAESLRFTVTIGAGVNPYRTVPEESLFYMSVELVKRIVDLGSACGASHGEDRMLRDIRRFSKDGALAFLEAHFLRYDGARRSVRAADAREIRLLCPANPMEEAKQTAENILALVKGEAYRWREIAVISADFENCADLLGDEFRRQGIPFHIDRSLSVAYNPLPELLRAALGCVSEYFSGRSFLRFLKCGLVTEDREMLARCNSYMTLCGVRGFQKLSSDWIFVPQALAGTDMEALNGFKNQALQLLLPLREAFEGNRASVGAVAECLLLLMKACHAEEKLQHLKEDFEQKKDAEHAREFSDVHAETVRILTEMQDLIGEEAVSREDMMGILDAGLREIRVGQIPAFADQVMIGDLMRSRLGDVRALFLLGANDGILPLKKKEGGILNDREKELLRVNGLVLAPTAREDLCTQRFYLYRVVTQPSDRLLLSFPRLGRDGRAQRPSGIINHLLYLFPGLEECLPGRSGQAYYSRIQAERDLISGFRALRADGNPEALPHDTKALLLRYCDDRAHREKAEQLIDAAFFCYQPEQLTPGTARALYGETISGSVTRLETFFRCPCSHFYRYGLKLSELKAFEFERRDMGSLVHRAIELVFLRAGNRRMDLARLEDGERMRFVDSCVDEAISRDESGLYGDSARNIWLTEKLRRVVQKSVGIMTYRLRQGDYRPAAAEFSFSAEQASALSVPLSGGGSLKLQGKADRVDLCEEGDRLYVKIIDYKTGSTSWEPYRLLSGSQIQLIVYLDAVSEILEKTRPEVSVIPGAVFYAEIDDPFLRREEAKTEQDAFLKALKELKPSGLVNAEPDALRHLAKDPERAGDFLPLSFQKSGLKVGEQAVFAPRFAKLRDYVRKKVKRAGAEILGGAAAASPLLEGGRDVCAFCPYRAVCGFDLRSGGYHYRKNIRRSAAKVWAEMDEQSGEEGEE